MALTWRAPGSAMSACSAAWTPCRSPPPGRAGGGRGAPATEARPLRAARRPRRRRPPRRRPSSVRAPPSPGVDRPATTSETTWGGRSACQRTWPGFSALTSRQRCCLAWSELLDCLPPMQISWRTESSWPRSLFQRDVWQAGFPPFLPHPAQLQSPCCSSFLSCSQRTALGRETAPRQARGRPESWQLAPPTRGARGQSARCQHLATHPERPSVEREPAGAPGQVRWTPELRPGQARQAPRAVMPAGRPAERGRRGEREQEQGLRQGRGQQPGLRLAPRRPVREAPAARAAGGQEVPRPPETPPWLTVRVWRWRAARTEPWPPESWSQSVQRSAGWSQQTSGPRASAESPAKSVRVDELRRGPAVPAAVWAVLRGPPRVQEPPVSCPAPATRRAATP